MLILIICVTYISNLETVAGVYSRHAIEPIHLTNFIQQEDGIKKSLTRHDPEISKELTQTSTVSSSQISQIIPDNPDGELSLKTRKVWSRWGKWGECSVTCGEGMMTRKRICVAGRCAPGELEEQRRPCYQTHCYTAPVFEELRDQD